MVKTNERWENFKRQVLEWKKAHKDEYIIFADMMNNKGDRGFRDMADIMKEQLPELMEAWESRWQDDSSDEMRDLDEIVLKSDILKKCIGEVQTNETEDKSHIGPLTLCWIIYGQMFESIVRYYESLKESKHVNFIQRRVIMPLLIKIAIKVSVNNGYRTKHDWDMYFKLAKAYKEDLSVAETTWEDMKAELTDERELTILEEANLTLQKANGENAKLNDELANMQTQLNDAKTQGNTAGRKKSKSQPLADYLTCENKEAVISIIRQYIEQNNSGKPIALTFVALRELGIISGKINNVEFYNALALQFPDIKDMRSESSCKHALGEVLKTQKIYKDGRQCDGRLHEDDKYAPLYNALIQKLSQCLDK